MAEARSAVSYQVEKSNLLFQVTEEEIVLRINKNVLPSSLTRLRRTVVRKAYRTRNALANAFHPAPPLQWAFLVTAPAAVMLSYPPGSDGTAAVVASDPDALPLVISLPSSMAPLLQPLSEFLWGLERYIPFQDSFSLLSAAHAKIAKAAIISASVGTGAILCLSYLRRILLSALLSYQGWLYDEPKAVNYKTMVWAFLVKLISGQHSFRITSQKPLMLSNQQALPRLPVPALKSTCTKYLLSVKPLLSEEQFKEMENLVQTFQKNEGRKLQLYLKMKSWISDNYVADWWEKYVYLKGRSPIMINSNYYILDSGLPNPPTKHQAARAATIISFVLEFKHNLDRELIPPMSIRGTVPMCMAQYERMFSTTRIPGREIDTLMHDDYDSVTHVVVMRKGHYYTMDVYDEDGNPLSASEIEVQLKWIINDADKEAPTESEANIAALTAENRTTWAVAREEFFSVGINRVSLDAIEKALFVLSLDHEDPGQEWTDMGKSLFHGSGSNRWFDKSFTIVVFPNAKAGLNVEHSWADAPVISHMWEYAVIVGVSPEHYDEKGWNKRLRPLTPRSPPIKLKWDLTQKAEKVISTAMDNARRLIEDVDLKIVVYDKYGKGFIKTCRVSPDAYFQMSMQIAYKRDAGHFALTYESSMTRLFRLGRTETVRPVSLASAAFVNSFEDPSVPKQDKIKLLSKAAEAHQQYYRDCMTGKGIDRHLFALYVVSQGMGVESQFLKSALSMEWKLSTSQQPQGQTGIWNPSRSKEEAAKTSPGGGFGPVSDDGYGVSYMIAGEERLGFHVSSKKSSPHTDSARFANQLCKALDDMQILFSK